MFGNCNTCEAFRPLEVPAGLTPQEKAASQGGGLCLRNAPQVVALLTPVKPTPANPQGVGYNVQGMFPPVKSDWGCCAWGAAVASSQVTN